MKENEVPNIDDLLISEKKSRESGDYNECFETCLNILNEIKSTSNNYKFEIISKLFLFPDQSNFVRINLMHALFQDENFINSICLKRKYYQLLIDSFKNENSSDYLKQKNDIIQLYEKSDLDNFDDIDKYIVTLVSTSTTNTTNEDQKEKLETEKNFINDEKDSFERKTNQIENNILLGSICSSTNRLNKQQENLLPQNSTTFDDEFNSNRQNETVQKIMESSGMRKNQIKQLLKKYKPNNRLPVIIVSVSANLNKNQFLKLILNTFLKLNYKPICNIKDTEFENLNVYKYHPKNCCENIKYLCKNKYIRNEFQVLVILKRDENNFTKGVHSFLNDINERMISIKSIKGNEDSINQFFIIFLSKFCLYINKIKIIKQSKSLLKYNVENSIQKIIQNKKNEIFSSKKLPKDMLYNSQSSNYQQLITDETYVEKINSYSKKFYELYKILSKEEYELGRSIKKFIDEFKKKYRFLTIDQINSLETKNIIMEIVKILELCTNSLNSTYNNNINQEEDDIIFFSLASEQFLFNKIYYIIYDIYDKKYQKINNDFLQKQKEINEKLSINELFQKIGIKKKFRGPDKIPFKSVIDIVNMVPLEKSLKKKFEILTQGSLEIRTYILEYTNGKHELDSMDDELPIIIFITTQVKVANLFAELNIVDEYIKSISRLDLFQNKMVTNLLSSMMYISKSWNKETLSFDNN